MAKSKLIDEVAQDEIEAVPQTIPQGKEVVTPVEEVKAEDPGHATRAFRA